jgi:hypothetical protein
MLSEQPSGAALPEKPAIQSSKGNVQNVRFFTTRNLSVIVSGSVLITALLKAESKDVPTIVSALVGSDEVAVVGWAIAGVILVSSVVLVRIMMKIHDREIERLANERDKLQTKLLKMLPAKGERES